MSATATRTPEPEAPAERNTVLLIVVGTLAAISVVIAALVIFSSGEGAARKPDATAPVSATGSYLTLGKSDAPTRVVVYEDFGSAASREFEIASRDFLRIEAARGSVQVQYRPYRSGTSEYGADALQAWAGVLAAGTPRQALAFHDVLFDRQPSSGSPTPSELVTWAEDKGIHQQKVHAAMAQPDNALVASADRAARAARVAGAPAVVLGGTPVSAASPTALADTLQRRILQLDH